VQTLSNWQALVSGTSEKIGDSSPATKRRFRIVLSLVLAGAVLAAGAVFLLRRSARPFPEASEIERIEASVIDPESNRHVKFEVPRSHWDAIFSAMLPAKQDNHPMKWVGFGHLDLKLNSGGAFRIDLFSSGEDVGAFAAGPTFESRIYYRGGDSTELEQAIAVALNASRERPRDANAAAVSNVAKARK
jgi:hypothetical protein